MDKEPVGVLTVTEEQASPVAGNRPTPRCARNHKSQISNWTFEIGNLRSRGAVPARSSGLFTLGTMRCVDREVSLEEQGTKANRFNAVFGALLGASLFLRRSLEKLSLQAAPRHRPIASLWKVRLSIALIRE